ncbi:MAG: FAD-dependent oxidoreductase, partial [Saprospiraceae bacterium]|nr:FAD-dependent oxidoreductase [Saprospiraceae bacterium]
MNRQEHRNQLESEQFDLCIIGGGASGAGCALDAALRGLKVALLEKTDFAAETSSKSTKLIHGGVRYLEQAIMKFDLAQLRQVWHGMQERHLLLQNAPHLTRALPLITPVFDRTSSWYYAIGLKMYDLFAKKEHRLPRSKLLGPKEVHKRLPGLSRKIHGGVVYYDGQIDDARYNLALVQSAARSGAKVLNHAEVEGFEKDVHGKLCAVQVRDHYSNETFRLQARCFLNCTGPFADTIRTMAQPGIQPRIR